MDVQPAAQQHSQQEDGSYQQQGAFSIHRGEALELGRRASSTSPRRRCLPGTFSAYPESAGGWGTMDGRARMHPGCHGDGAAAAGAGGHGDGAAAAGAGGLDAGLFHSGSRGMHTGVGGAAIGGAPGSPGSLCLTTSGAWKKKPPVSPPNVSAANMAPRRGVALPLFSTLRNMIPGSQTAAGSGGGGGKRAAVEVLPHDNRSPSPGHGSNKQPRTAGRGISASGSTGGRPKGHLAQQAKACHTCRNNRPTDDGRHACLGAGEGCHYWLCRKCVRKWQQTSGLAGGFRCCLHGGNREWCGCER